MANKKSERNKVLLVRFSSFGDIIQCLSVPSRIKELAPETEVHWVTRSDFAPLLAGHPRIDRIWPLERKQGLRGLWTLIWALRKEKYTHIYDAHSNLRSHVIAFFVAAPELLRKSQKRLLRFLLFRLRINKFEMPFSGQRDLLEPLEEWGLGKELPSTPQLFISDKSLSRAKTLLGDWAALPFVTIAASAAYPLKRWPLGHWKELLKTDLRRFVLLGGPEDQFLEDIRKIAPERIRNFAGTCSLLESAAVVSLSTALVANDTGLLHVAEQLGKPCIALMGPAPFGFPSRPSTTILQLDLPCRPCSKHGQGPCINSKFQKCLVDILPFQVKMELAKKAPLV